MVLGLAFEINPRWHWGVTGRMPKTVDAVFLRRRFLLGIFHLYITWLHLVKNLTPREEKSAGQNKIVFANYKGELALRSQTKNLRRLSMFQECSKSSLDGVASLYALGDAFVLTMKGPSHLGSSLPLDSVRAVRTSTRSPSLNSLGMTAWSCHAFVWACIYLEPVRRRRGLHRWCDTPVSPRVSLKCQTKNHYFMWTKVSMSIKIT
jgi:hypothetical protein